MDRDDELVRKDAELRAVFSEQVLARMEKQERSINMLADFAGLSRSFLSAVLRKKKAPTIRTISAVALALKVEPWELLKPTAKRK